MSGPRLERDQALALLTLARDGHEREIQDARRRHQAEAIVSYWPWSLLKAWASNGTWNLFFLPTTWKDVERSAVVWWFQDFLEASGGILPKIATVQRRWGKTPNHRLTGEHPSQAAMELGGPDTPARVA